MEKTPMNYSVRLAGMAAIAFIVACGGERKAAGPESTAAPATPSPAAGPVTPGPGGKVIPVELITDEKGNYFQPAEIAAKQGDVIRYTLKLGVHNVRFLADSNTGKSGYPSAASDMLQLPGQTYDVVVNFPPGTYYFQCDPHAALGMKGHVTVSK
jgi:plastocyanin